MRWGERKREKKNEGGRVRGRERKQETKWERGAEGERMLVRDREKENTD